MSTVDPRYFTVEQANALLPQLRVLMLDLQAKKRELDQGGTALVELNQKVRGNGGNVDEEQWTKRQREMEQLAEEINDLVEKVHELGCQVKDLNAGLVDFPSLREGREVLLCWRLGEERVAFWHGLDTGFTGRQPL